MKSFLITGIETESTTTGDHHALPGAVYTKGFLRSYAEYLDLDSTELYATQPVLMFNVESPRSTFVLRTTLNFEGVTQPDGEITPGGWGEGFIDRRHPHTWLHEIGVAVFNPDQVGGEDLLRQADTAMYIAKSERCGFSHYAAGDAFNGGLAAGLIRFPGDLVKALRFATVVAGLSTERAGSVVRLLSTRLRDPARLRAEGLADADPLVANDGAANRAKNRRVEIVLRTGP